MSSSSNIVSHLSPLPSSVCRFLLCLPQPLSSALGAHSTAVYRDAPSPRGRRHCLAFLGTARLGEAETPVHNGPGPRAPPSRARSARSLHMAIAWQLRCWSHISRHACSAQSCRSLFCYPAGILSTQGMQEPARHQAKLHRRSRQMGGCAQACQMSKGAGQSSVACRPSRHLFSSSEHLDRPRHPTCDTQTL